MTRVSTHDNDGTRGATRDRSANDSHERIDPRAPGAIPKRVSWGAIFAGAVIAMAIMFLLTLLGIGIGAAVIDPALDTDPTAGVPIGSGIFMIVAQLLALGAGGYAAARLAGIPFKQGSMLHGAAVWALATFGLLFFATTTVSNVAGGVTSLVTGAGNGLASATAAVIPNDLTFDSVTPDSLPPELRSAIEKRDLTLSDLRQEADSAFSSVVSDSEQANATEAVKEAAANAARSPTEVGSIASNLMDNLFGGSGAVMSEEDKEQAIAEMADQMGISTEEAKDKIDKWQATAAEAADEAEQALADAKQASVEAAQAVSDGVATAALLAFLASLLGLLASVGGAIAGRPTDMLVDN